MNNAYMIRQDGKLIPVTVHIYGATDDPEETLYAAEWLYANTASQATRSLVVDLLASYAHNLDPDVTLNEIEPTLVYQIKHLPYKTVSESFVKSLNFSNAKMYDDLQSINLAVNDALNQEFLRARYGGKYDSDNPAGGEMYFRISSVGFDWFPIIWTFVYDNRRQISSVTVLKDPEATGQSNAYLRHGSEVIKHMPTDEFINLSGRPVLDKRTVDVTDVLPNMNANRRHNRLLHLHAKDSAFSKVGSKS